MDGQNDKILVCITPQTNSRRLIKKGAELTSDNNGELHILHVRKGNNIFGEKGSANLLDMLFQYGSALGGIVHALASENVVDCISTFAKEMDIDIIILGEQPRTAKNKLLNLLADDIVNQIKHSLPHIKIEILQREEAVKVPKVKAPQIASFS